MGVQIVTGKHRIHLFDATLRCPFARRSEAYEDGQALESVAPMKDRSRDR